MTTATPLANLHASSFTISFWLKPLVAGPFVQTVLVSDPAFTVMMMADGTIMFSIADSVNSTTTSVRTLGSVAGNQWNFVTVVYNLASGYLFI